MYEEYATRTIKCLGCNQVVTKRMPKNKKYCSITCYRTCKIRPKTKGKTVKCKVCHKKIYLRSNRLKYKNNFCSKSHATVWQRHTKVKQKCKICKKTFYSSPSKKTMKYCSLDCRNNDPDKKIQLIKMNIMQQQKNGPNKLEKLGYTLLDELKVIYNPQFLINDKFCVDAFIECKKLIIQFDGDYWHGNPEKYPNPNPRQIKRKNLDKSQDAYMVKCGYKVIRIWENKLKDNYDSVKELLNETLRCHNGHG